MSYNYHVHLNLITLELIFRREKKECKEILFHRNKILSRRNYFDIFVDSVRQTVFLRITPVSVRLKLLIRKKHSANLLTENFFTI